jgi:hypothetical protein
MGHPALRSGRDDDANKQGQRQLRRFWLRQNDDFVGLRQNDDSGVSALKFVVQLNPPLAMKLSRMGHPAMMAVCPIHAASPSYRGFCQIR